MSNWRLDVFTLTGDQIINDTLAEWLRRWPAKPLGSARASSNLVGVVCINLVLWCSWLSLWTLNPATRVRIPEEPTSAFFFHY